VIDLSPGCGVAGAAFVNRAVGYLGLAHNEVQQAYLQAALEAQIVKSISDPRSRLHMPMLKSEAGANDDDDDGNNGSGKRARTDGGKNDGGKNDGGKNDGGKKDGSKNDNGKKDGGKNDGGKNDGGKNDKGKKDGGGKIDNGKKDDSGGGSGSSLRAMLQAAKTGIGSIKPEEDDEDVIL
jgi:hypothetical protein